MKPVNQVARVFMALACAAVLAVGCAKQIQAPGDAGVCWQMVTLANGQVRFNKVSQNEPNVEGCAGSLEGMRMRFASLVGYRDVTGAYQGNFLFLTSRGIFMSQSLDGVRYLLLVPTGDGRLARPSAIPQQ